MLKHTDRRILTLKAKFSREGRLRRVGGRSDRKWWDLGGSHHRQTSHQFWSEIHNRIHWIYTGYNRMHCPCCISQLHLSEYMHYGVPSLKKTWILFGSMNSFAEILPLYFVLLLFWMSCPHGALARQGKQGSHIDYEAAAGPHISLCQVDFLSDILMQGMCHCQ